ncbi:ATP synthase subunit I [Sphingomonas oryzagri]
MTALIALLFLALGAIAGATHFTAIAKDADLLVHGGPVIRAIGLKLGRLLFTATILVLAARHGWIDLLTATIGFMAARQYVIHRLGPTP